MSDIAASVCQRSINISVDRMAVCRNEARGKRLDYFNVGFHTVMKGNVGRAIVDCGNSFDHTALVHPAKLIARTLCVHDFLNASPLSCISIQCR
jgi:Na+-transporting NADH:ubiquinone oxidoreductase subunit NqrA